MASLAPAIVCGCPERIGMHVQVGTFEPDTCPTCGEERRLQVWTSDEVAEMESATEKDVYGPMRANILKHLRSYAKTITTEPKRDYKSQTWDEWFVLFLAWRETEDGELARSIDEASDHVQIFFPGG